MTQTLLQDQNPSNVVMMMAAGRNVGKTSSTAIDMLSVYDGFGYVTNRKNSTSQYWGVAELVNCPNSQDGYRVIVNNGKVQGSPQHKCYTLHGELFDLTERQAAVVATAMYNMRENQTLGRSFYLTKFQLYVDLARQKVFFTKTPPIGTWIL